MLKFIHFIEDTIIKGLLVWITGLVFLDVVLRFVFNTGFIWLQELTLYSAAWMVILGAGWAIRHGAHIGISVFVNRLPSGRRRLVALLALLLCFVYCCLFLYGSAVYLQKLYTIGIEMEDIAFPKWIAMLVLPLGFISIMCRLGGIAWGVVKGDTYGFTFNDEGKDSLDAIKSNN